MTPVTDELRRILSSEEKWTKGVLAGNGYGTPVPLYSKEASCYCLSAACIIAGDNLKLGVSKVIDLFEPLLDGRVPNIINFNDNCSTTFQDIQNLLNEVAKIEEQRNEQREHASNR